MVSVPVIQVDPLNVPDVGPKPLGIALPDVLFRACIKEERMLGVATSGRLSL